jgi:hypothetical protein
MPVRPLLTIHRPIKILKKDSPDISFSSAHLSDFYFPGRGFIASLILHAAVFIGSIFIPLFWLYLFPPSGPDRVVFIELNEPTTVMYLPPLWGSEQTAAPPEGEENEGNESPAPPSVFEGLTYRGPQPILSDPSDPTNDIQTILQPKVENPPILEPPQLVPNILQTEKTLPVVQKPPESIFKMDFVPPERMDVSDRVLISPDLPAEAQNPGMQFPAAEMPDPIKSADEPEMVLPESELTLLERMNPLDQNLASTASPVVNSAPNTDVPAAQLPAQIRSATEPEMVLPKADLAPLEQMNLPDQDLASTASPVVNSVPYTDSPATQLPGLIKTAPGSEMNLPESQFTPIQRVNPSKRPVAPTDSPAFNPRPETAFSDAQIPGQIKTTAESEMPMPGSQLIPIQRMDTSKRAIAPEDELLALTPIPVIPSQKDVVFPEGEELGRFAISPRPNLDTSKMEPGAKQKDMPKKNSSPAANPVYGELEVETNRGTGEDPFVVFTNTGAEYKSNEASAAGPGENAFQGVTIVGSEYEPRDELNIKDSESEDDSLASISITGGTYEPSNNPDHDLVIHTPPPLQTFFDLYVISTPNSGSQLLSYGFCEDRQIYTGFLDMRLTEIEQDPPWTLEFCLHEEAESGSILAVDEEHSQEGFLPPFPKEKKRPNFPEVLERQHLDEKIIIKGIVDTEGMLKGLFPMNATQNLLASRAVDALRTWAFRPALLYGKPVEVQILIGIPLWLPDDVSK